MGLKTNLNTAPYYDDYSVIKDYYKVLFKPGLATQTRELNNMQSMFSNQIEQFANHVFKPGTILAGVNFQFYKPYPFVRILDNDLEAFPTIPSNYQGNIIEDESNGLKAYIINYADGFEIDPANNKTLYLQYINSGNDGNTTTFTQNQTLTIYYANRGITAINITSSPAGFSNNDSLVVSPAMVVNVNSGTFANGDYLISAAGANVEIYEVDTTSLANTGKTIFKIKPHDTHLIDPNVNSTRWTFDILDVVSTPDGSAVATIENFYGSGITGQIKTNSLGVINDIDIISRGSGYTVLPYCTVQSSNNSVSIGSLVLEPKNYVTKVKSMNVADAVGNGYAFGVTGGVIYDAGHFVRVSPQTVLVSKYDQSPTGLVAGFVTKEEIITTSEDSTLFDNATGEPNENAPGADRLKLTPELVIASKEAVAANEQFFTLVEWNDGYPYKQNSPTQYSALGDAMAQQIYDHSGNFVLDAFHVTTDSVLNNNNYASQYSVIVDPGQAYINGRKVQTLSNYRVDLAKGTDTKVGNNAITLNYGNYIRVNEAVGTFDLSTAASVDLKSLPRDYLSTTSQYNGANSNLTSLGTTIGTAKVRSVELESGVPGKPDAVYRIYLFDIQLNAGRNFREIKSIHYNPGSNRDAIADVVLELDPTTGKYIAELKEPNNNQLLFYSGVESLKNSNTSTYEYRTTLTSNTVVATGTITISTVDLNEYFSYGPDRALTLGEMQEMIVVPVEEDLISNTVLDGTVAINTTSTTVTGTSTNFFEDFIVGDYVFLSNTTADCIRRVTAITSTTSMTVDSVPSIANATAEYRRCFPINVPIPFGYREGLTANVDLAGTSVIFQFGHANGTAFGFANTAETYLDTKVTCNIERRNVQSSTKTSVRNKYVKISLANNAGRSLGPWCLGVPDIFRLRAVYVGSNSSVNTSSTDATNDFYIDHNQNANYMGLGYLYKHKLSGLSLSSSDWLLVAFDYFTRDDAGYYDTRSYLRTANSTEIFALDSLKFANLSVSSAAASWEVPEVYTYDNKYYDLYNNFDFRPTVDATASPAATHGTAPVNPAETITFTSYAKFPRPKSTMRTQTEQYLGRLDDVYIGETGNIYVLKGIPDVNPRKRLQSNHPKDSLRLQVLHVPPYPNITKNVNDYYLEILDTKTFNEKSNKLRAKVSMIEPLITTTNLQVSQPMVYTMEDIAALERRIADLEYYVSLSVLETNISNKIIASSVDSTLTRFKYGFFADDFSTTIYSDVNNPQYAASIESEGDQGFGTDANPLDPNTAGSDVSNPITSSIMQPTKVITKETNRLVPPKYIWSMRHFTENLSYVDELIIEQNNATTEPDIPDNPCIIVANTSVTVPATNTYITSIGKNKTYFTAYAEGNIVDIYVRIYDVNGARVVVKDDAGNEIANANNIVKLSSSDQTFIQNSQYTKTWYEAISTSGFTNTYRKLSDYTLTGSYTLFDGVGKIRINSTPGKNYIIEVYHGSRDSSMHKILIVYKTTVSSAAATINDPDCNPQNPPVYNGTLEAGRLSLTQWSCSNWFRVNATNYKAFVLKANGLKPNTVHKFYMDTEEWPHVINLTFDLFKASRIDSRWSQATKAQKNSELIVFSSKRKVNELARFFKLARGRMYDADGNPTNNTLIKSDNNGYARMLIFFPMEIAGWFSQDFNALAYSEQKRNKSKSYYEASNFAGVKLSPTYGSSGYTSLGLKSADGTSQAIRVFANRTPNKTIPYDPKGNI